MPQPKQLQLITLFGLLMLVIGTGMFGYSLILLTENEQTLNSTDVTLDQLWNFESSLDWWKNVCVTLILPLTSVFILITGLTLSAQAILQSIKNQRATAIDPETLEIAFSKNQIKIKSEEEKMVESS
ncbi:MAG: hypothetical protein OQK81_00810 [Candidatus Bathyarchaeota archaeon]|nr:hypothetical protein [Candidatus Bathyarchaeota archaeon]